MDDDIVFLGSSPASHTLPISRPAQRPVTGVSLHVEKNGTIDAHCLSFQRVAGNVVHIGRRSTLDPPIDENNGASSASFRCAVVSRCHAKIAFSDSGHAYLIDLGSHHGTHVRSPADRVARALKPETPTLLVDGDVITFGKAVGKGDECVRPIILRVELLHGDDNKPQAFVPTLSPSSSPASSKASSGRYGIRTTTSSSSSDESADGYSDIEEIPPPVQSSPSVNQPSQPQSSQTSYGHLPLPFRFRQLNALRRFLPPIHAIPQSAPWRADTYHDGHSHGHLHPIHPTFRHAPSTQPLALVPVGPTLMPPVRLSPPIPPLHSVTTFVERPLAHLSQLSQFFLNGRSAGETSDTSTNNAQAGSTNAEANAENVTTNAEANTAIPPAEVSPSPQSSSAEFSEPLDRLMPGSDIYYPSVGILPGHDNIEDPQNFFATEWPPVDGAFNRAFYEDSDSESDFSAASSRNSEREERERARDKGQDGDGERETSEPMELASRSSSPSPLVEYTDKSKRRATDVEVEVEADEGGEKDMDIENDVDALADLDALPKHVSRRIEKTRQMAVRRIEEAVERLQADLTIHRGQTKATLAKQATQMELFDGRIREVDAECGVLCVRVETLSERVGVVEMDVVSAAEVSFNAIEAEAEKVRVSDDARKEGVDAVRALIAEAQDELRALKALRAEAEAHGARQQEQECQREREQVRAIYYASAAGPDADDGAPQLPVLPSLKRKRDDSDEDAAVDADEAAHPPEHKENEKDADVVMDASPLPIATSTSGFDSSASASSTSALTSPLDATTNAMLPTIVHHDTRPPPRKRARRIVGLMARTATAVGVGAVVTWTALAFS